MPKTKNRKITCRSSGTANQGAIGRGRGRGKTCVKTTNKKKSEMLSKSREHTYGITPTVKTTRTRSGNLRPIDYLSLNDRLDNHVEPTSPKKKKCTTHRPKSGPSASRIAAQVQITSPHPKIKPNVGLPLTAVPPSAAEDLTESPVMTDSLVSKPKSARSTNTPTLSVVPSSTVQNQTLTGIPPYSEAVQDILPDLVVNTQNLDNTVTTEEDLAAADTLLSLIEPRDDTQNEDDDDNARLMPVGGPSDIVDAAPVSLELNQVDVDRAIANIVEMEELQKSVNKDTAENLNFESTKPTQTDNTSEDTIPYSAEDNQTVEQNKDNLPPAPSYQESI